MKYLFYLLFALLFAMALCSGCATKKRIIKSSVYSSESQNTNIATHREASEKISEKTTIKDTSISIPANHVSGIVKIADLRPLYTPEGKPMARTFEVKNKGLSSKITVLPDSSIEQSASQDSINIVIKNLVDKVTRLESKEASSSDSSKVTKKIEVMSYSEVLKKSGNWLLRNWLLVVGFIALVYIDSLIAPFKRLFTLIKPKKNNE